MGPITAEVLTLQILQSGIEREGSSVRTEPRSIQEIIDDATQMVKHAASAVKTMLEKSPDRPASEGLDASPSNAHAAPVVDGVGTRRSGNVSLGDVKSQDSLAESMGVRSKSYNTEPAELEKAVNDLAAANQVQNRTHKIPNPGHPPSSCTVPSYRAQHQKAQILTSQTLFS